MDSKANHIEVEDLQLAEACIGGDSRAQAQLFEIYSPPMMAMCLRYGENYAEAQDMLQNGFVKVYQKLHLYNGKGPLGAWIRKTVANNALDQIRKNRRERDHWFELKTEVESERDVELAELSESDLEQLTLVQLMDLIQKMPTGYRMVFNLYAVEEYSHKEIAEKLGVTESTSKTQYRKAKAYMRRLVEQELKETCSAQRLI